MISFYILSKSFFQKRYELFQARIISITKNNYHFPVYFYIDPSTLESQYLMND